ncbi:MAG: glycoside hydrolase family 16 protein [Lachnospiraceae bacterium]|nr:glycoside hydrolase family 16 protein [Lachnospiraceae bacterium]
MIKISDNIKKVFASATVLSVAFCGAVVMSNVNAKDVNADSVGYNLVWSDEFEGDSLDRNTWEPLIGNGAVHHNPGWGNNELEYYTGNEGEDGNILVSKGTLKIIPKEEVVESDEGTFKYTSTRMVTAGKQSFKYGKIEARIKLPSVDGLWPAFWMMGKDVKEGWPYCGEIDILETWNTDQLVQSAWHWYDDYHPTKPNWNMYVARQMNDRMSLFKGFDKTKWHTYGVIWTKDTMEFTVDDKVYYTQKIDGSMTEANNEYYFLLNVAVGGNLTFGKLPVKGSLTPDKAAMEVDYVRVYQMNGTGATHTSTWNESSKKSVPQYNVLVKNDNKTVINEKVYQGATLKLSAPVKSKYLFNNWIATNGNVITNNTRITSDIVVNANWKKVTVAKAKIKKLSAGKKIAKVKVNCSGAKGIQVKYSLKKSFRKASTKTVDGKSITITKLKSGKKYYVKARAYKLDSKKEKVFGKWSAAKKVVVK